MIEDTIRQANAGENFFRRPVPLSDIVQLRNGLAEAGFELTVDQAQSAVDYGQALLRESPSKALELKVAGMSANRKAFHGNVAELAEARARDMILTKSPRSETFDLTEAKARPRSAQMKVYTDELAGIREALADLKQAPRQARHAIMPLSSLKKGVEAGLLTKRPISGTEFDVANDGSKTVFLSSKVFDNPVASQTYADQGRSILYSMKPKADAPIYRDPTPPPLNGPTRTANAIGQAAEAGLGLFLIYQSAPEAYEDVVRVSDPLTRTEKHYLRLGEHGTTTLGGGLMATSGAINIVARFSQVLASSRWMAFGKWAGRGGLVVVIGADGFVIWQYRSSLITPRQFWTTQAALAGGLAGGVVGGWAGAGAGALVGGGIGALFGPEGAPIGAVIGGVIGSMGGGFGGAYLGSSWAVGGTNYYYRWKDEQHERQYQDFLYSHYGVK